MQTMSHMYVTLLHATRGRTGAVALGGAGPLNWLGVLASGVFLVLSLGVFVKACFASRPALTLTLQFNRVIDT